MVDPNATVLRQPARVLGQWRQGDLLLAGGGAIESALRQGGFPAGPGEPGLPPATDAAVFAPPAAPAFDCDVLLVGDVAAVDAESMGIEWPSHRRLWEECLRQVRRDPGGFGPDRADRYVARAERSAGLAVRDAELRDRFVDALRRTGGPSTLRRLTAEAIESAGCDFRLAGSGWADGGFDASRVIARPTDWAGWRRLICSARLVVFVPDADEPPQELLHAAACGAAILARIAPEQTASDAVSRDPGPETALSKTVPESVFTLGNLFNVGGEVAGFCTPDELVRLIGRYLAREPDRAALGRAARRRVERDHLYAHRLATILRGLNDQRTY